MPNSKHHNLSAIFMAISLVGTLILVAIYVLTGHTNYKFALTIDAGSTHSKVILYRWKADKVNDTGQVEELDSCDVQPGISSYVDDNIDEVADPINECVSSLVANLDMVSRRHVPLYLAATAGMRVVQLSDAASAQLVFNKLRDEFEYAGFNPQRVSILTGAEEGLFAWVAANYLSGSLFHNTAHQTFAGVHTSNHTYGILDMGGASAQIAHQVAPSETDSDLVNITLFGNNYSVSSYSNLCFGAQQAFYRYLRLIITKHRGSKRIQVSCFPKGLNISSSKFKLNNECTRIRDDETSGEPPEHELIGTGEPEQCQQSVNEILDLQRCREKFLLCFKPAVGPKESVFYAISAYNYLTEVLDVKSDLHHVPQDNFLSATRELCASTAQQLKHNPKAMDKYIHQLCFQLIYIHSTLTRVYNFNRTSWNNLRFTSKINNSHLGWSLGFTIHQSSAIPADSAYKSTFDFVLYTIAFVILSVLFVSSIIVMVKMYFGTRKAQSQLPMYQVSTRTNNGTYEMPTLQHEDITY